MYTSNTLTVESANKVFLRRKSDGDDRYSADQRRSSYSGDQRRLSYLRPHSVIQIDALEKKWIVSSSKCDLNELKRLLKIDSDLIDKKDVFTGFAAAHWAAKKGRDDVIGWLLTENADINIRTFGGYTPLHIATIHNKSELMKKLIKEYNADINIRDNSGRKARHYVSNEVPFAVYRSLQETYSILDMKVDPTVLHASEYHKTQSLPSSASMPAIAEQSSPKELKKKRKGLTLSTSFKGPRKFLVKKREPKDDSSPTSKPRWRKALSVPDVSMISGPIVSFEQEI